MVMAILLALVLFGIVSAFVAGLGRATISVVSTYVDAKESVERSKRQRAIAATKTATELWKADVDSEHEWVNESVPTMDMRAYLISKHGDNIAAYDAWKKASSGRAGEHTAVYAEMFAWKKARKENPALSIPQPLDPTDQTKPKE